jgi:hypothetical protein
MPGSLPAVTINVFLSTSQQSQYHTQANAFPSQQELNNWTKVSYKRGRSTQDETEREVKHAKESVHWLSQTSRSNRYTSCTRGE